MRGEHFLEVVNRWPVLDLLVQVLVEDVEAGEQLLLLDAQRHLLLHVVDLALDHRELCARQHLLHLIVQERTVLDGKAQEVQSKNENVRE